MHHTTRVKKSCQHYLDVAPNLSCFFVSWWCLMLPLWWLKSCFRVVSIHPCVITSDDGLHEVRNTVSTVKQVLCNFEAELFLLFHQQLSNKFCRHTSHGQISSLKIVWTEPVLIPYFPKISLMDIRRFSSTIRRKLAMNSSFLLVDGLTDRGLLSTEVCPCLMRLYHFFISVISMD